MEDNTETVWFGKFLRHFSVIVKTPVLSSLTGLVSVKGFSLLREVSVSKRIMFIPKNKKVLAYKHKDF